LYVSVRSTPEPVSNTGQIFNFQKAYFILDELLLAGEMQESSKKNVLRVISAQDSIEDTEVDEEVTKIM